MTPDILSEYCPPSPKYLQDWGGFLGTGGDSRGLERWWKTAAKALVVIRDVHHQPVRESVPAGSDSRGPDRQQGAMFTQMSLIANMLADVRVLSWRWR